ncbi:hypothetical protein LPJ57_007943, partial [Coemansia sp. RSA 486]
MLRGGSSSHAGGSSRSSKDNEPAARFSKQFSDFILNLGDIRNVEYIQVNYPEGYNMLLVGHELIQSIRRYDGASDEIRTAISQPSSENEEAAWRKICPSAQLLRKCYEYAQSI